MRKRVLCHMRTTNKGADQPAHPRSLLSTFVVRCLDSMICILAISKVSRFELASVAEQAGLNVTWLKIPEDTFSRDVAHIESGSFRPLSRSPLSRFAHFPFRPESFRPGSFRPLSRSPLSRFAHFPVRP